MVSTETGLPDSLDPGRRLRDSQEIDPATTRNIKWIARLGTATYSTPVVANGKVIIGSCDCDPLRANDAKHHYNGLILCFEEATGKLLWRLIVPWRKELQGSDDLNIGVASTAAIDGKYAYIVSNRGEVLCLDVNGLADGNDGPFKDEANYQNNLLNFTPDDTAGATGADIVWSYDMLTELGIRPHISCASSILIHGDLLYVATCNATDREGKKDHSEIAPSLIVLNKKTGELIATDDEGIGTRLNHGQYSSPTLAKVNGRELILYAGGDGFCYAFDAVPVAQPNLKLRLLKKVWWCDCNPPEYRFKDGKPIPYGSPNGPSEIIGTPAVVRNQVYVALGQDWTHAGSNGCFNCIDATKTGDISTDGKVWSDAKFPRTNSTAAIVDGLLYIPDQFGTLHCYEADTGAQLWTHKVKGEVCGSALVADRKVYLGSRGSEELCILAAGRQLKVLNTIKFTAPIHSTPVAANGVLYIATNTHLYAIQK